MIASEGTAVTLAANVEVLLMQGAALVTGIGTSLNNTLLGNALGNVLFGLAGADSLAGGAGVDFLLGGAGADTLTGGSQADRFRFDAVSESTPLAGDRITDFVFAEGDRILLSLIDANTPAAGDQAFAFIGTAAFGGTGAASAGQLRVEAMSYGEWRAQGDVNGDGVADLQIDIASNTAPVAVWFIL
jgi:serralysin